MKLTFAGAAGTVTGSRYLIHSGRRRILIDCGLFQGYKQLRLRNRAPFPVPPRNINTVLLTHAHLDHSGYLPALVRDGFRGQVICTEATRDLCELLLRDSGYLQEEEARYANMLGFSKHSPAEPLYTVADAERALTHFRVAPFNTEFDLGDALHGAFLPAGHIIGAALIRVSRGSHSMVFSGDLGRPDSALLKAPTKLREADTLVLESTYGNRTHENEDSFGELAQIVRDTAGQGGTVLIPSFAVGRSQDVMLGLARLKREGAIPNLPIYLDSPMAIDASELYRRHRDQHRITIEECRAMFRVAQMCNTPEQSRAIANNPVPAIIIAASGMATGGRVLHHLKRLLPDSRNHVVFVGFQAGGTRGAHLVDGDREVKIHGEWHPVRAAISQLHGLSAHADADQIMAWLESLRRAPPKQVYLTHGEPAASDALRLRIESHFGWPVRVPEHLESVEVEL